MEFYAFHFSKILTFRTGKKTRKKEKERKIHSILTYQMENNRKGCINRDKNGCKNIQKIFNSYIETGERPEKYRREIKVSNRFI